MREIDWFHVLLFVVSTVFSFDTDDMHRAAESHRKIPAKDHTWVEFYFYIHTHTKSCFNDAWEHSYSTISVFAKVLAPSSASEMETCKIKVVQKSFMTFDLQACLRRRMSWDSFCASRLSMTKLKREAWWTPRARLCVPPPDRGTHTFSRFIKMRDAYGLLLFSLH